jgi:hypothetical protein
MAGLPIVFAEVAKGGQAPRGPRPLILPQLGQGSGLLHLHDLQPLASTLDQRQHHLTQVEVVLPHVKGWQLHGHGRETGGGGSVGRSSRCFVEHRGAAPPFYTPHTPF